MADRMFQMSGFLLPEVASELAKTRKSLERAPEEHASFKPHERSTALLPLCNHLATVSGLTGTILAVDEVDMGSPTDPRRIVKEVNIASILAVFDELAAITLERLKTADDAEFHAAWKATRAGNVVFSGTRYSAIRQMGINHMIHHRAQLGLYLRHLDVAVPAHFGPTADER